MEEAKEQGCWVVYERMRLFNPGPVKEDSLAKTVPVIFPQLYCILVNPLRLCDLVSMYLLIATMTRFRVAKQL